MLDEFVSGEGFEKRVAKCEQYAARHPEAYRRRVLAMARLGYWLVPVILAVLLALPAYVFWHIFTGDWQLAEQIIYGAMWGFYALSMGQMAQALFVPHSPVEGLDVTEEDAPELFSAIAAVREKLDAPELDRVVLVSELNAAAAQVPKRSFMRQTTNELLIGLPLLEALEPDELQAVIAHEFGHFSGAHGHDSFIVSRTIRAWEITLATSEDYAGWTGFVPLIIAKWFVPRFMAYSFALRRDNEFLADWAAVEAAGAEAAGRALIRVQLAAIHAEDCKDKYFNQALQSAYAPGEPLNHIYTDLGNASLDAQAEGRMMLALHTQNDPMDTHPGLRARLDAIGVVAAVPAPVQQPAIGLLGGFAAQAYAHYNAEAHQNIAESWAEAHADYLESKAAFDRLNAQAAAGKLSIDDALYRARLCDIAGAENDRLKCLTETVCWYPGEARALYAMGMHLAGEHDMQAAEFLDSAAAIDETASGAVLELAANLAAVRNDAETVEACRRQAAAWFEENAERIGKLHEPAPGAELRAYDSDFGLEEFAEALGENSYKLARAYLVIKPMPEWLDERVWLIVEPRLYGHFISVEELCSDIYDSAIDAGLPPTFRIWVLEKGEDWLRSQLADMPGALIWASDSSVELEAPPVQSDAEAA